MLDLETRTAILRLTREGHGMRKIAKALGVSRNAVRGVVRSGQAEVPPLQREDCLTPHIERIRELYVACERNLARVAEELAAELDQDVPYSTLTAFCRRHDITHKPKKRAGQYHFEPGEEMQHDTSPHKVKVGGRVLSLHCASLVLCYSRMHYSQCFPRWTRFHAKLFLTDAISYFEGAAERCMLDNSNVIVLRGTGTNAVMVPEMVAFGERFGTTFVAHEKGDANRSAHVERGFWMVERNFYPGRTFADLADLNAQQRVWCDTRNALYRRRLKASPRDLFAVESPALAPLPLHVPAVYDLHHRRVDTEGYVSLHRNRYSAPAALIGRQVTVHEHGGVVRIFDGHQLIIEHDKRPFSAGQRVMHPSHRGQRRPRSQQPPLPEERVLRAASPELAALVDALRRYHGGRAAKTVRRLHRIYLEYPTEPVVTAVARALEFGLVDLSRIERMVLQQVAGDFFRLPNPNPEDDHGR